MDLLHHGAALVGPYLQTYGLFALFALISLESVGLPLPGETALIACVALAYEGAFPILAVFMIASSAAVLGDGIGYCVGRFGGRILLERFGSRIGLTTERRIWVEDLYTRHGAIVVVAARFVPVLRQLNGPVAGTLAMPWPIFFVANCVGAVLWAGAWSFAPYVFVHLAQHLMG